MSSFENVEIFEDTKNLCEKNGRIKDAELLSQINTDKINVSQCGNYVDYFFGPMLPDMSYAKVFYL